MNISEAEKKLQEIGVRSALELNQRLSEKYQCRIFLKREDQQLVRSYKIRGAYNKISSLNKAELERGIVCASAGNHAQGVAFTCRYLGIQGDIYMPANTPLQKIGRVKKWGDKHVRIFLTGDTYDDCYNTALTSEDSIAKVFIDPFNDLKIIEGQGTVAKEITDELKEIDFVFIPVGGGGLAAGMGTWFSEYSPHTKLIAIEPKGAASLTKAMEVGCPFELEKIDSFVDGAAVKKIGSLNFPIIQQTISEVYTVAEGKVCATLLELYNEEAMVVEPAGALAVSALDDFVEEIKGKTVVCIVSGGNNDVMRMEEIRKLAEAYEGLHNHLIIRFKHQPDGLRELFTTILGDGNFVTRLEYERREHGRTTFGLVGIKSVSLKDYIRFKEHLRDMKVEFEEVKKDDFLFKYWV